MSYTTTRTDVLTLTICSDDVGRPVDSVLQRIARAAIKKERNITSPTDVFALCRNMARLTHERLVGIYLDAQNTLIAKHVISKGTLNTTRSHPRDILRPAIVNHAMGFILVHNHPSGTLSPSSDDVEFTRAVSRAADLMGIPLYDHVIISSEGHVSLKEKGLL